MTPLYTGIAAAILVRQGPPWMDSRLHASSLNTAEAVATAMEPPLAALAILCPNAWLQGNESDDHHQAGQNNAKETNSQTEQNLKQCVRFLMHLLRRAGFPALESEVSFPRPCKDYSICFLPNDHSVLPLARSNNADEVCKLLGGGPTQNFMELHRMDVNVVAARFLFAQMSRVLSEETQFDGPAAGSCLPSSGVLGAARGRSAVCI